jgi:DNA-directed RNA polymerase specialized sigma subunit
MNFKQLKKEELHKYISRREIATQLGISKEGVKQHCLRRDVLQPIGYFGRFLYYDRAKTEAWILKFKNNKHHVNAKKETTKVTDVYGIRSNKKKIIYSGKMLMHILFCQPALRNGKYTYEDCGNDNDD